MSASLRWRQSWASSSLSYGEGWADAWALATNAMAAGGHATVAGNLSYGVAFSIGSGAMDSTGHGTLITAGLDFIEPGIATVSGTLNAGGHATLAATLDYEEAFFVDPPLQLAPGGHLTTSGTLTALINKTIGSGAMAAGGHMGFLTTTLNYQISVVKPLFAVTLATGGHAVLTGTVAATTIKNVGAGLMATSGHSTITQTGFSISAPAPYTHPVGSATMALVGAADLQGDPVYSTVPPTDIGSLSLSMVGHSTVTADRMFAGGVLILPPLSLTAQGRPQLVTRFSYPGETYPDTEAVAVYEGTDMQEAVADLEGDGIVV